MGLIPTSPWAFFHISVYSTASFNTPNLLAVGWKLHLCPAPVFLDSPQKIQMFARGFPDNTVRNAEDQM